MKIKPKWAPKVPMNLIRCLYENDALGIVDEELLDDVGIRLSLRCESIVKVMEAQNGRVSCPLCDSVMQRTEPLLECRCGWSLPWITYWLTYRHHELSGDPEMFKYFPSQWERCLTPKKKMLLIDDLIHRWHWEQTAKEGPGRLTGVNLIEGNRKQVIAFLDELTGGSKTVLESWQTANGGVDHTRMVFKERGQTDESALLEGQPVSA